MPGPYPGIKLAEPVSPSALHAFDSVPVERLCLARPTGLGRPEGLAGNRPFLVDLMGPGVGDEETFEAVLGFTPTHRVGVGAGCDARIDHAATALLSAAVMDVLGGVVQAELADGQLPLITGLPGGAGSRAGHR